MTVNEIDFPESEALMVNVLPERDAVREEGLGGLVPSSYRWKS